MGFPFKFLTPSPEKEVLHGRSLLTDDKIKNVKSLTVLFSYLRSLRIEGRMGMQLCCFLFQLLVRANRGLLSR